MLSTSLPTVDLRSDTVTRPSRPMLEASLKADTGDDVFGEDPTVKLLESHTADLFGKEKGLFVPTGTMSNLTAILAHCHGRASEIIIGTQSHICLWEGGNVANLGGVHSRQVPENEDGVMDLESIKDCFRLDNDDHFAETKLICLENSHNMAGGIALPKSYIDDVCNLSKELRIRTHIDGARIFNSSVSLGVPVSELCQNADSISVCLSKGLGAPIGSVLVGESEFIRLAKRARKRCGGGMRQAGVIASMGLYSLQHNIERMQDDHNRAKRIAKSLFDHGFQQPQEGNVDTNIVYFGLGENTSVSMDELTSRLLDQYGVKIGGGYGKGGKLFRLVTHMDVDDEGIDRALDGITSICNA